MDDLEALDQWAKKRAKAVSSRVNRDFMIDGRNSSERDLGRHEAYMAVRSFIHGLRQNTVKN